MRASKEHKTRAQLSAHYFRKRRATQLAGQGGWEEAENRAKAPSMLHFVFAGLSCTKGKKGGSDNAPNQDNFSVTRCKDGSAHFCI